MLASEWWSKLLVCWIHQISVPYTNASTYLCPHHVSRLRSLSMSSLIQGRKKITWKAIGRWLLINTLCSVPGNARSKSISRATESYVTNRRMGNKRPCILDTPTWQSLMTIENLAVELTYNKPCLIQLPLNAQHFFATHSVNGSCPAIVAL